MYSKALLAYTHSFEEIFQDNFSWILPNFIDITLNSPLTPFSCEWSRVNLKLQETPEKKLNSVQLRSLCCQFWSPKWKIKLPKNDSCGHLKHGYLTSLYQKQFRRRMVQWCTKSAQKANLLCMDLFLNNRLWIFWILNAKIWSIT